MTTNIVNNMAYLRTSRKFPSDDVGTLALELDKSYIDTANAINTRIIGVFPTGRSAITGETWYLSGRKQQTLRQVFQFTGTSNIAHNIRFSQISGMTRMWGTYTDGTNWYGLCTTSSTAIVGQWGFYLDPTNIVFTDGGGTPTLTSGTIVLEWLAQL